jgi:AcrR family transcriptional regulator
VARTRLTREESRRQTQDRLLTSAAELFAERGVNGTSVEQIAERAGYSRGAFYGNFADKNEAVRALLLQRTQRELEEVRALSEGVGSPAEVMDRLREWNRERDRYLPQWLSLRLEMVLHCLRQEQAADALAGRERLARGAIAEGIRRDMAGRGVEPPADPGFLALIVHALEDGLLIQRALLPEGVGPVAPVDAVELLMASWAALARERADGEHPSDGEHRSDDGS